MKHICKLDCLKDVKHIWKLHKMKIIIGVVIVGSMIENWLM